jgi:putative nucleotidyltransferase with HDIG domain
MRTDRPAVSKLGASLFAAGLGAGLATIARPSVLGMTLSAVAAVVLAAYLHAFQPRAARGLLRLTLLAVVVLGWALAARVLLGNEASAGGRRYLVYALPVAAAPIVVTALLEAGLGVLVAVVLGLVCAATIAPAQPFEMASVFILGGVAGAAAMRRSERLARYPLAGAWVTGATLATSLAFWLASGSRGAADLGWMLLAAALAGLGAATIGLGGTVILGFAFGIPTRVQLMGMAQLSHPLLRSLQEQAPGTFHHSVIVGNLAERAADVIGADALLVRVGSYFHDIGKSIKPAYFVENQSGGENPYDKLDPLASARMIADHVLAGVELARRHGVPESVSAFIPEHHGTRLITYFYRKAAAGDPQTDPERFRYPGPKPQSKETAIVMLADSVEAIVRSSKDRSPERIESLVNAVLAERVAEGQLDECDLTMRDLRTIADSFRVTLHGVYHARVDYPAPQAREESLVAAALSAPAPLVGPMDGTAPPAEAAASKVR